MSSNKTFFIIKPEVIKNHKLGELLDFILHHDFKLSKTKRIWATENQLKEHYYHLKDKPFFKDLLNYMTSGPILIGILEKNNAIEEWRKLLGNTNPDLAESGTIRQKFGYISDGIIYNTAHGSDSLENFNKEVKIWYK